MHAIDFLHDLAVVMIVAGLVTILFHRLKQPVVLGYIIAGVIIGPHTPPSPLIHSEETIHTLAELGIIFLMFSLGLEFSLGKLKKVGATAFIAAFLEILLMFFAGYQIGQAFGWSRMDSLFLGAMLSISSTTIIIKALAELGKSKENFASLVFGVLIVEDILAIVMLALLSGIALTGTLSAGEVAVTVGKLGVFLVASLIIGLLAVPRLLGYVGRFKSQEMLLVTVLGLCFGFSLLALEMGYSVALGAFIIGAIIAEAREIGKVEALMAPIRDMFSAVFFVAIGLLIQPKMLVTYAVPILVITIVVVLGKVLSCSLGTFVAGHDTRTSLKVGMSLAQIGEFSFIIAALGLNLKVTSDFLYPIAVTVSALTTLLTPYLIKNSDNLVTLFDRVASKSLVANLQLYTQWVGQLGTGGRSNIASGLIRKWLFQIALNTALIAAVFIAAAFVAKRPPSWLPSLFLDPEHRNSLFWLVAAIITLPLFIASYRKLQALGLLIADLRFNRGTLAARKASIQGMVSQTIALTGTVGLALLALILSSTLLPPLKILIVLFFVLGLISWLLWRTFIRVYSKAQIALQETFAMPSGDHGLAEPPIPIPLKSILTQAKLETVPVHSTSLAAGKLIREIQLRTVSGATIVGIERQGNSLVNPGPDEEILAGDELLLIGQEDQLGRARAVLAQKSQ